MRPKRHPTEVGFERAMVVAVRNDGESVLRELSALARARSIIYAFTDYQETVFRIGHTTIPLIDRVYGYRNVMRQGEKLRPSQRADGFKMLEFTGKQPFTVWAKQPGQLKLELGIRLLQEIRSLHAEEIFWIYYYEPKFNKLI